MAHEIETMFFAGRKTPWHGLGIQVVAALSSAEALEQSGLDWSVIQTPIYTGNGHLIPNFKANVRDKDSSILGIVSDRYSVVQNVEAFEFTDNLLGEGVRYETAGVLQGGRRVWLLAKLPERYIINGEKIEPFLVFSNSHDGSAAITVAMTPIRVVCQNTLNLALNQAKRAWSSKHVGNIQGKLHEAHETLELAQSYMDNLGREIDSLNRIKLTDSRVMDIIYNELFPEPENATPIQKKNIKQIRDDLITRYFEAPDLKILPKTAYRFVNAVSDHSTHSTPLRQTSSYNENLFIRTLDGLALLDKAHNLVKAAA
jgi:phage/plasmid-like protein (TIGR03299 family)